jgi:DNA topoisomerase VI subunit B
MKKENKRKSNPKKSSSSLQRITFSTSRELEYFTEKELTMQLGHEHSAWRLAVLKELIDNALDACEIAGITPEIMVDVDAEGFTVADNGTGILSETVVKSTDYMMRVSDKAYYVAPTRGQLGNALKAVYAAPFVDTGERSLVTIESRGLRHTIEVSLDRIAQKPSLGYSTDESEVVKGTRIRVEWPADSACLQEDAETDDSYKSNYKSKLLLTTESELLAAYSAFNPHAVFRFNGSVWNKKPIKDWRKWQPNDPISPHWYNTQTLRDLIAAHVSAEKDGGRKKTVREFVSEFRGLSSTIKQKKVTEDFSGAYLHDLVKNGDLDMKRITHLLSIMQLASIAPKPIALGLIGEDYLRAWSFLYADVAVLSFTYRKALGMTGGIPHVWEIGFGVQNKDDAKRKLITGLNWSPTFDEPSQEITRILGEMRVDRHDPVLVIIHCVRPRFEFTGKSKSGIEL